jgi:hypothetical protein
LREAVSLSNQAYSTLFLRWPFFFSGGTIPPRVNRFAARP